MAVCKFAVKEQVMYVGRLEDKIMKWQLLLICTIVYILMFIFGWLGFHLIYKISFYTLFFLFLRILFIRQYTLQEKISIFGRKRNRDGIMERDKHAKCLVLSKSVVAKVKMPR